MNIGDKVIDDLTGKECTILEIIKDGVILDDNYFEGYRFDWEVTELMGNDK